MLDRDLARLELVDLLVDVLERIVVGGAEELAAADVGDFLQRVVVDIDRDGGVDDAAEDVAHGKFGHVGRARADGVNLDARARARPRRRRAA